MESNKAKDNVEEALSTMMKANHEDVTRSESIKVYDSWSNYDETVAELHYRGHKVTADAVLKYLADNKDVRILDVAAGTGLVGKELKAHGFTNIDGLDASEGMLNISREKNVYKNYIHEFFPCEEPSVKTSTYDVLVMAAAVGENHVRHDCLPEMLRCVKKGGLIVICTRRTGSDSLEEYIDQFQSTIKKLEIEGQCETLENTAVHKFYHTRNAVLLVLKVTKDDM